jgi:outer membrane protein assembly factor BamB
VARTSTYFEHPGVTPSISSNKTEDGILWAAQNTNPAVLHAYDALTLQELYNTNQAINGRDHFGAGNKFITPLIANGKVYVGTTNGVGVFGLLSPGGEGSK